MTNSETNSAPFIQGFVFLDRKDDLQAEFERSGVEGIVDLIGAILATGGETQAEIERLVEGVGGARSRALAASLLHYHAQLPSMYWQVFPNGRYSLVADFKVVEPAAA